MATQTRRSSCHGRRARTRWRSPRMSSGPWSSGWMPAPATSRWSANRAQNDRQARRDRPRRARLWPPGGLDPVEEVEEALGQRLVAAGVAAVDAAERGEHQAARIEVDHRGQVVDLAGLVRHPLVGDADPVAARVAAADGDADGERAEVGAG